MIDAPRSAASSLPLLAALLLLSVVASGCIASRPSASDGPTANAPAPGAPTSDASPSDRSAPDRSVRDGATGSASDAQAVEASLRRAASDWVGVPHRWGGTTQRGVDCSGLVRALYAESFSMTLPRTTDRQARLGGRVDGARLQPGDLVFFRPGRGKRHVGVYLSDGEFVHASSSTGVTVSRLDERYWQRHWWQARRLLPDAASGPHAGAPTDASAPETPRSQRTGW